MSSSWGKVKYFKDFGSIYFGGNMYMTSLYGIRTFERETFHWYALIKTKRRRCIRHVCTCNLDHAASYIRRF